MARKPRPNPNAEFVKQSADIIKALLTSAYLPIARLASVEAFEAAQDRITNLLNVTARDYTPDDFKPILVNIGTAIKQVKETKEYVTRFKKDANGYSFTFYKKESQGGEIEFNSLINLFPGAAVRNFSTSLSANDKLSIIWAMMAAAGFSFTPQEGEFTAYYTPEVIANDPKSRQKRAEKDEISMATGDLTGIGGLVENLGLYANFIHTQPVASAAFQGQLKYKVEVVELGNDVTVTIRPSVDLSISGQLATQYMAETDDKSATDYLVFAWMNDARDRALRGGRKLATNLRPAVDMRITSKKLKGVAARYGVAKPRLNKYGFCINRAGVPMWVPAVDDTASFMRDHANFSVDDDGYLNYEAAAYQWSSKIILTDWFNDVIVYTTTNGIPDVYSLLGYVPLDSSSEYVMLNTDIQDARFKGMIFNDLAAVVRDLVNAEEASKELPVEYTTPNSYNAGRVTKSFGTLLAEAVRPLRRNLDAVDKDFRHESVYRPLIKHLFAIELEELDVSDRGQFVHIAAYLRAAKRKRKDITVAIMNRLVGIEYFLKMASVFHTEGHWQSVTKDYKDEADRRKNQPLLSEIDIPNLDAGWDKNLKAWQPHQVRNFSNAASGANGALVTISTGGGKTLYTLVDILMGLTKNPAWRPLVVTKVRLVKNFISEVNWATKGKVNVVSLRISQLRYLATQLRITSAEGLIKWVKSFPVNTIFICSYQDFSSASQLYDDLDIPDRVLLEDVALPQFLHLLRIIGFDMLRLDESHSIKNMNSRRSRYAFSALAAAQNKALMSGTTVNNTAVDLVGQSYGINPAIFGSDVEKFKDRFNLPSGLIKTDEASQAINQRMRRFMQITTATEEDWAFLLPDLHDRMLAPNMTPLQEEFYSILMQRAYIELKAAIDEGGVGKDEEDDEDGDSDESFLMKADAKLVHVEQFLVAPDQNKEYVTWKKNPRGDDLISPAVKAIDAKLAEIYSNRGADHANNKAAVFGINKVASEHFMRYTKFKDLCMHYRAGDEEVIRQWKANPDKYIIVADSTSLREGENMQMLSHIFDMQATWTPGDFKQLLARMYRPDPKGVYAKDDVTHWWIVPNHKGVQPSLATVKLARMISKSISLARFRYEGDPRWREISFEFEGLDLLTMNLQTVFESDHNDLAPYFNAWSKFVRWERELNQKARIKIAEKVEAETGLRLVDDKGRVTDRQLFLKSVMTEAKSTKTIPGSKKVFVPWEKGAVPADMHDMALSILGTDEIERGAYVLTEYGPGIVHNVGETQLVVELYGRKKAKLYRDRIAIPNGDGANKLNAIIRNPSAWAAETYAEVTAPFTAIDKDASLAPKGGKIPTGTPKPPVAAPVKPPVAAPTINIRDLKKPPLVTTPEEEEEAVQAFEDIHVYLLNGMPALLLQDAPSGVENLGWMELPNYVAISFDSWKTADKFIDLMIAKFAITQSKLDTVMEELEEFQHGTQMRLSKRVTDSQSRNFFTSAHRKLKPSEDGRPRVDPYWIAIQSGPSAPSRVYLAFSKQSHDPKVFNWLRLVKTKQPKMVKDLKDVNANLHVKIFSTLAEAVSDLTELGKAFDIPENIVRRELREMKDSVDALRGRISKPITRR
ncbi:SNF2 family helicase protein [Rhizobium phage RHph_N28_1]|nr:SNF2 family helicase protein [Rhizobium phage RHph_N28_1]QIG74189.1 SNF2 family helicase protein [Rhizobium phage RHph_N42]